MLLAVLLLHLVLGILLLGAGQRLGAKAFLAAAVAPAATLVALGVEARSIVRGGAIAGSFDWVPQLGLTIDLRLDAVGLVLAFIVSGVGLLVCLYAVGYFSHPGPAIGRLAGLLTLFAGAMLGIAASDHLLALFVFWELTSITSYLLIGNDDEQPQARAAALSAILITGMGGLVMLAGFVVIGQDAGTYRLSELLTAPPTGTAASVGVVLVLVGAFTKSAQFPFGGWLPGAMVAPTPISTYLHAATMVKAGVFLVARLAPVLGEVSTWRPIVLTVASVTMITGAWRALRQHDLKLLLAYGTVSQLGFLMLLFGTGVYAIAQAGLVVLIAHAAFKAALFMVVGIVDHQTGTRDVRRLAGLGRTWWPVVAISVVAAASMAGVPPLVGFIGKEKALDGLLHADFGGATAVVAVVVVGSVLTFAYSARFVLGVSGRLVDHSEPDLLLAPGSSPAPAAAFVAPAALLGLASLAFGVVPWLIDALVRGATTTLYTESKPKHVELWAGFNSALLLSTIIIASGVVLVLIRVRVERLQRVAHRPIAWVPDANQAFTSTVSGVSRFGRRVTGLVQNGSLPAYLVVILGVAVVAPLGPALAGFDGFPALIGNWVHVPIVGVVTVAAVGATVIRRRIAAALMLGAVGFAMAAFYVVQGAPDLALTQFAIETLATVLFVLVLRFLPREFVDERAAIRLPIRLAVAGLTFVGIFVFALVASQARDDVAQPSVSAEMLERSVPDGKGSNVVNVILVDFRGFDTLGEITVLAVAALGLVALARAARHPGDGVGTERPPFARLLVVDASARLLYPSILVVAVYLLFAGHNQPGGGFVGGLTAAAAISLRYLAGGLEAVRRSVPVAPWTVLGIGLATSVTTAIMPLVLGGSVLEHALWEADLPVLGTVKTTSALPFDIGVFLVVLGVILMAYEAFGEEATDHADGADGADGSAATGAVNA
jgi:multicomponent Na+:H+ antiporter subunit A